MLRGRVVLQFRSEAIKTENPATVQCDAFQIDIFSRQEARRYLCQQLLCWLQLHRTMTCQFVFSQFFLVWMPSPQDGNWSKEEKMSEPLRDNDEATPYGYTVP